MRAVAWNLVGVVKAVVHKPGDERGLADWNRQTNGDFIQDYHSALQEKPA